MKRFVWSWLMGLALATALLIGLPMASAQAAGGTVTSDSTEAAIRAVFDNTITYSESGGQKRIQLTADITQASQIVIQGGNVALDLHGNSITGMPAKPSGDYSFALVAKSGATLTITDSVGGGYIRNDNGVAVSLSSGTNNVTIEGGSFYGGVLYGTGYCAIQSTYSNSTLTVRGGSFFGGQGVSALAHSLCSLAGGKIVLDTQKTTRIGGILIRNNGLLTVRDNQQWKYRGSINNWHALPTTFPGNMPPYVNGSGTVNLLLYYKPTSFVQPAPANAITGVRNGQSFPQSDAPVYIKPVGGGSDNSEPQKGDIRGLPYSWEIVPDGPKGDIASDGDPSFQTLDLPEGSYTLRVRFLQQRYDGADWVDNEEGIPDYPTVQFTVSNSVPSSAPPMTGDHASPALWAGLMALVGLTALIAARRLRYGA